MLKSWEGKYQLIFQGEIGHVSSLLSQFPLTLINSPAGFLLELGRHDISLTMVFRD